MKVKIKIDFVWLLVAVLIIVGVHYTIPECSKVIKWVSIVSLYSVIMWMHTIVKSYGNK